jgi:hypothetical protein
MDITDLRIIALAYGYGRGLGGIKKILMKRQGCRLREMNNE